MSGLVRLTAVFWERGEASGVWINPNAVSSVEFRSNPFLVGTKAVVRMKNRDYFWVIESREEILKLLPNIKNENG